LNTNGYWYTVRKMVLIAPISKCSLENIEEITQCKILLFDQMLDFSSAM
jgi:hypothetical protein